MLNKDEKVIILCVALIIMLFVLIYNQNKDKNDYDCYYDCSNMKAYKYCDVKQLFLCDNNNTKELIHEVCYNYCIK